jgi:hypothetical protein
MKNLARAAQQVHYLALAAKSRQRAVLAEQMLDVAGAGVHVKLAEGYEALAHSAGVLSRFPASRPVV